MNTMLELVTNVQANVNELRSSESVSNILDLMQNDVSKPC